MATDYGKGPAGPALRSKVRPYAPVGPQMPAYKPPANPRPGGSPKGKFGPTAGLVASGQGQNRMGVGGTAGAGKSRNTSRVAAALNKRAPTVPYRGEAQQVNESRDGARGQK